MHDLSFGLSLYSNVIALNCAFIEYHNDFELVFNLNEKQTLKKK